MEPSTPPDYLAYLAYRRMQFSEFSGWDDIVAWASRLFQRQGELSQDVREVIEKLRQRPTDEDRVVGALEFVQSEIRYFSVSLGESSHRPTQPDVVVKQRYGDCKDKSLLLMTLLEALGIQSKPVLVAIGMRKGLDNVLPSPELFNHAIVQVTVNGKVFYLDPTLLGQHGRLERMGQLHEGAQVLVVAPQSRQLSSIASTNARDLVRSEVAETVTLPKFNADGQLQVRQVWRGSMAEALRIMQQRLLRDELVRSVGEAMETRYPGAKLLGEPDILDDRSQQRVLHDRPVRRPQAGDGARGLLVRALLSRKHDWRVGHAALVDAYKSSATTGVSLRCALHIRGQVPRRSQCHQPSAGQHCGQQILQLHGQIVLSRQHTPRTSSS